MAPVSLKLGAHDTPQRRHDDDEVSTVGMPWQIRAIALIGVPSVIALSLVWFLQTDVRGAQKDLAQAQAEQIEVITRHVEAAAALIKAIDAAEENHKASAERMESYMLLNCLNGAKTKDVVSACMSVARR